MSLILEKHSDHEEDPLPVIFSRQLVDAGVVISASHNPMEFNGIKFFDENSKKWLCDKCFRKFIEVGQKLQINEEIPPGSFSMVGSRSATLKFYKSLKPNPIFTFEKGVEKIAECKLDA